MLRSNATAPCTPCPDHLTTSQTGGLSLDDCNMCKAGYGGEDCATQCGGSSGNATYGPAGRSKGTECLPCPVVKLGYFFDFQAVNQGFAPAVVARVSARSLADCLAEFAQVDDLAWFMGGSVAMAPVEANSFEACVEDCKADAACQYLTFDYKTRRCSKKVAANISLDPTG